MTTGNSAAMTVSVAGVAPPDYSKSDCKELDKRNEKERDKATEGLMGESENPDNSPSKQKAVDNALEKAEGGGMTVSSAKVNVGISSGGSINGVATGCSSQKAQQCTSGSMVEGGTPQMRSGKERILCGHQHVEGGAGAHGEAKILNEMTSLAKGAGGQLAGGSVLFNVNWRYNQPDGNVYESGMPCRLCYRAMCAAADCGIEIMLCDKDNNPQPFDPDEKCKDEAKEDPREDPYEDLDRRMGEDPYKGLGAVR
jgi:hypothetical protein